MGRIRNRDFWGYLQETGKLKHLPMHPSNYAKERVSVQFDAFEEIWRNARSSILHEIAEFIIENNKCPLDYIDTLIKSNAENKIDCEW